MEDLNRSSECPSSPFALTGLFQLESELLMRAFAFLSAGELLAFVRPVCRAWALMLERPVLVPLWKAALEREVPNLKEKRLLRLLCFQWRQYVNGDTLFVLGQKMRRMLFPIPESNYETTHGTCINGHEPRECSDWKKYGTPSWMRRYLVYRNVECVIFAIMHDGLEKFLRSVDYAWSPSLNPAVPWNLCSSASTGSDMVLYPLGCYMKKRRALRIRNLARSLQSKKMRERVRQKYQTREMGCDIPGHIRYLDMRYCIAPILVQNVSHLPGRRGWPQAYIISVSAQRVSDANLWNPSFEGEEAVWPWELVWRNAELSTCLPKRLALNSKQYSYSFKRGEGWGRDAAEPNFEPYKGPRNPKLEDVYGHGVRLSQLEERVTIETFLRN